MVVGHCFQLVRKDKGASDKKKESQSSSSSRKRQKTSAPRVSQRRGAAIRAKARPGIPVSQGR